MSFVTVSMNPAQASGTVRREIERLLQDVVPTRVEAGWAPLANGYEDATGFTMEFDVPGFAPDQLEVMAADGVLSIRGNRPAQEKSNESRRMLVERPAGTFERQVRLPKTADVATMAATYAHGVLSVRVEKLATVTPRRVAISVGEAVSTPAPAAEK